MAGYVLYSLDPEKFRQLVEQPTADQLTALAKLTREGLDENDGEFDEDDPIASWPTKTKALVPIVQQRLALPDWYSDLSYAGKVLWEGVIFGACLDNEDIDVGFDAESDGIYWDGIELAWKHLRVVPNTVTDVSLSAFGTRPYRYVPPSGKGKTREEFDQERGEQRSSLEALGQMLNQFLEGAKKGEKDPTKLLDELNESKGVSKEHKNLIQSFLSDEDDDDDNELTVFTPMHSMHLPEEVGKMRQELKSVEGAIRAAKNEQATSDYEELMIVLDNIVAKGRMLFVQVDT